jgi:hypothetical protein
MRRTLAWTGLAALALLPLALTGQAPPTREVTFSKDIAPILYENCVYCHRPGEIAPFSMLSYKEARPWAKAMKEEVVSRRMPPWFADPHVGSFTNDKRLSDKAVQTITAWADSGAKEGNPADMPPAPQFADGWQIGTPDLVVTMQEPYKLPATGTIPYVTLPTDYVFPEDTWVSAIEVRPGNRKVVHHAFAVLGTLGVANGLHLYSPGLEAMIFREGYGKLIPKGTRIGLQMHYNAIGVETTDQSRVGFKFAKKPVHTEVHTEMVTNSSFSIPPMVQNHEIIAAFPIPTNARIHALRPHMHVRGKSASATLVLPDGKRKPLLSLPVWNDFWQYYYVFSKPESVPKGSLIEYVADYDNSPANPLNPDPKSPVLFGQQVWEEMQLLYVNWTEVNESNKNDTEPIQIPPNKMFTTGVFAPKAATR